MKKVLYIISLTIILNANCTQSKLTEANELFYKANQTKETQTQIKLLKRSLKRCFTYEVKFTLLNLQVAQKENKKEKLKIYDEMLETLSLIENRDELVRSEQSRINRVISKIYETDTPLLSTLYQKKAEAQTKIYREKKRDYLPWIIALLLLFLWVFGDFFKNWGKS